MTRRTALRRVFARQFVLVASLPLVLVVLLWGAAVLPEATQGIEAENAGAAALMRSQIGAVLSVPQRAVEMAAALIAAAPARSAQTQAVLQHTIASTPAIESLYVANARGVVEDAAVSLNAGVRAADLLGLDLSARPFYALARERGTLVWSDTFLSPLTGRVTAVIALPVGERMVVADMSLTGLAKELLARQRLHGAQVIVLDAKGRVIVHPQQQLANWQENLSHLPLMRSALAGQPASGEIELGGERWLATVATAQPTGWYVLVAQPHAKLYAPLKRIAWVVGIAVALGLTIAVVMGLRMAGVVADRYRRLASAAQAMVDDPERKREPELDLGSEETHALWERLRTVLDRLQEQEQRAKSAQADLQAVLDAATEVAVIATDLAGVIRVFNRGAEKMLGYSAADLVGRETPERLFDAADISARTLELQQQLGRPVHRMQAFVAVAREVGYEVRDWTCLRKDGSRLLVSMAITAIRDAGGTLTGFLAIAIDQTQRLRAAELELARERAEVASQAKSDFLSRVSHELRTPLNAMLGYAQLLSIDAERLLAPAQRERVARIESAGWHLVRLIDDVLDLSRIESGRLQLSMEPVDLANVIAEAVRMIAPQAALQGISIAQHTAHAASGLAPLVHADRTRLKQVLVNLLSNAVKYNVAGGRVEVMLIEPDERRLSVSVTDTGRGMDAAQLERLFEPFDRLGLERSEIQGTGIGLVITRRLIDMMQGRIEVQSEPHVGSVFTVTLPRAEHGYGAADSAHGRLEGVDERIAGDVVYVEDNVVNAMLMQEVFALRPACRLHLAGTMAAGRELIERLRPQLVLVDLHLPDGSGLALIEWLQADPSRRAIPAIVVSADATRLQEEAAMKAGARAYLHKPIRVADALELIDDTLRG
jgi:PAS domain S-box-containing protein